MKHVSVVAAVAVAFALVGAAGSCRSQQAEAACSDSHRCLPAITFEDINHEMYPPESLRDKVVVVNFWATWCGPCKREIPAFNRVYTRYKARDVIMLGVLNDSRVDDNGLLNFMSDYEMTYPVVKADGDVLHAFEYPDALPTTFIYGKDGKLLRAQRGPLEEDELTAVLDRVLGPAEQPGR